MKLRHLLLGRKAMTHLDSILKSRDITLPVMVHIVKDMVFPVVIYRCESWTIKKGWGPKNWCNWTVVLEKTLASPLDSKEVKPVNPKGNQCWIFIERTDAESEAPIHCPHDAQSWFVGKDWCWERLKAKVEGGNRGWDCWMALLTQWTWVWANSRRLWRTGWPGVLQSLGLKRVRRDLATELA